MSKDQFYTNPEVAANCFNIVQDIIKELNIKDPFYIEPSAGTGSFFDLMPQQARLGMDIDPKHNEIIKQDYLTFNINNAPKNAIVIGNPPFGTHGRLATKFINISAHFAKVIGFIVPSKFHRIYFQRHIDPSLYLISRTPLPEKSFHKPDNSKYSIPCQFIVWSKILGSFKDLRDRTNIADHPDFEIFNFNGQLASRLLSKTRIYNNKQFVFGVCPDIYKGNTGVYSTEFNLEKIKEEPNKHWILLYANNIEVKQRLLSLDFKELLSRCSFIYAKISKKDIVEAYNRKYKPINKPETQLGLF